MENSEQNIKYFITEIVNKKMEFGLKEAAQIKPIYENEFKILDELNSIKNEICYCQIFQLYLGSITLTNHLLEKYLKTSLIYWEFGFKMLDNLNTMDKQYKEGIDKYGGLDLNKTINISCSKGLIDKTDKKLLHDFRERLRNGFSHSDSRKIFKGIKIPLWMGSFKDFESKGLQHKECEISEIPQLQGIAIQEFAKYNSFNYFNCVYIIIKKIEGKIEQSPK